MAVNQANNLTNDPMFDYILARSRTRESSTLTIATVAASASLILIALFIQSEIEAGGCSDKCDNEDTSKCGNKCVLFNKHKILIIIMGLAFATAGIIYREITKKLIHDNDENWLQAYISDWLDDRLQLRGIRIIGRTHNCQVIRDPLQHQSKNVLREITLRALLSVPIIAWFYIVYQIDPWQICAILLGIGIPMGYAVALSLYQAFN